MTKSRAKYHREYRNGKKQLAFSVDAEKAMLLEDKLKTRGENKSEWFRHVLDRELEDE